MSCVNVRVSFHLSDAQALALAKFCKRVGWNEMRDCAVDEFEAYLIRDALSALQAELADRGYAPR
jgi:hypothetical protein